LRDRARKLHEGIVIVRFELPFNIWCAGCGNHAGMGVRYNAEKSQVGKYYTTPIFRFCMKCTMCENRFEIETDPKNFDYKVVSGASRQNQTPTPDEGEMHSLPGQSEAERLAKDPMYRLEHGVKDEQKAKESVPQIEQLQKLQEGKKDDFALNQMLRKRFRISLSHVEF
jgi:coiled-coil domain-containing protein 130